MRISPLMNHQNAGVSGATHDRVGQGKALPAPEIMTLRTMSKTPTTPSSLRSSRMKGKRANTADNEDLEDINYLPVSKEDVSLGNDDFIVPEEPLEQERFKRRLIATAWSLEKKQQ